MLHFPEKFVLFVYEYFPFFIKENFIRENNMNTKCILSDESYQWKHEISIKNTMLTS